MSMEQISGTVTFLDNVDYELVGDVVIDSSVDMSSFTGSFNVATGSSYTLTVEPSFSGTFNFNTYSEGGVSGTVNYLGGLGTENFNVGAGTLLYSGTSTFAGVVSGAGNFAFTGSSLTVTSDAFGGGTNAPLSGNLVVDAGQTIKFQYVVTHSPGWTSDDYKYKQFGVEGSGTIAVTIAERKGPYFIMGDLTNFTGTIQGGYHQDAAPTIMGETGSNVITVDGYVAGGTTGTIFIAGETVNGGTTYGSNSKVYVKGSGTRAFALYAFGGRPVQYIEGVTASGATLYGGPLGNATKADLYQYTTSSDITVGGGKATAFIANVYGGGNGGTVFGDTHVAVLSGGSANYVQGAGARASAPVAGNTFVTINGGTVGTVYGGGLGPVTENTNVSLVSGSVGSLYGAGQTNDVAGTATVTVTGGTVGNLYGGAHGKNGNAASVGNTVVNINIGNTTSFTGNLYGGGADATAVTTGNASVNIISAGTFSRGIYGGGNNSPVEGTSTLNISAGTFTNYIYGGGNGATATSGNSAINFDLGDITFATVAFGGGNNGAVTGNSNITFDSGNFTKPLYGGGNAGTVGGTSSIVVNGGTFADALYGGGSGGSATSGNTRVEIKGGTVNSTIYGGGASAAVTGDTLVAVTMTSGTLAKIYGGGKNATATVGGTAGVLVDVSGSVSIANYIFGGGGGEVANTQVTVNGGSITAVVLGGGDGGTVTGNTDLVINGGTFANITAGAGHGSGSYVGGTSSLTITGGTFTGGVAYGGGNNGAAANSKLTFDAGTMTYARNAFGGGNSATATVSGNSELNIISGSFTNIIYGGGNSGTVGGTSSVNITGGVFSNSVFGGGLNATSGNSKVTIDTGTSTHAANYTYGGGNNAAAAVTGDSGIEIVSGTTTGNVYGGGNVAAVGGTASVTISGGSVGGNVFGGGNGGSATAANTSVTIAGGSVSSTVHAGGNNAAVTGTSTLNITGGVVTGATFGGGNVGTVGSSVVNISGGAISGNVAGTDRAGANADSVTINITGGTISSTIRGSQNGTAGSVTINVSDDAYFTSTGRIWGGGTNVTGDTLVNISGGTVEGNVWAGGDNIATTGGTATINVSGGTVTGVIYGSYYSHGTQVRTIVGDSLINVSGGTVKDIYYTQGGASNISVGGVVSSTISGDAEVISRIDGGYFHTGDATKVYGDVNFADYTGNFTANIQNVNAVNISGDTTLGLSRNVTFGADTDAKINITLDDRTAGGATLAAISTSSTGVGNSIKGHLNLVADAATLEGSYNYAVTEGIRFSDAELEEIKINGGTAAPAGWSFVKGGVNENILYFTNAATDISGEVLGSLTGTADDNGNSLTVVRDSTVTGNIYGGAQNATGNATLYLAGGTYSQIFSGSKVTSGGALGNAYAEVGNSSQLTRFFAGNAVLGSNATAGETQLVIKGSVDGTLATGAWNYGAGVVGQSGTLALENSIVSVSGTTGNAGNVIAGGRVELSGSLAVDQVESVIDNNVTTATAGSYINGGGTATVNNAFLSVNADAASVLGGGMVSGGGSYIGGTTSVIVAGAVSNAVFGGSYLTEKSSVSGSSEIAEAYVSFAPGALVAGIYGGDYVAAGSGTIGNVVLSLDGGSSSGCVFAGGYASGGTSAVGTASITVGENFTLDGNVYAGGYSDGGTTSVNATSITFSGSSVFSSKVVAAGFGDDSTVGAATLSFDGFTGSFAGRLDGDFDGVEISNTSSMDFTAADLGAALATKSGLLNVTGDTSSYDTSTEQKIFDLADSDTLDIGSVRVNNSALSVITEVTDYCYAWSDSTRDLWVVGADNIGDFSGYSFYTVA